MPIMDGYETAKRIRNFEKKNIKNKEKSTLIIGLSAHSTEVYRTKAIRSGMNMFGKALFTHSV